jgi:hypothetical protein
VVADFSAAVFRQGPFTVTVDDHSYTFPSLTADKWLDVLAHPAWHVAVFRLCDDDAREAFTDRVEQGDADELELKRIVHAALAEAGGRTWWEVTRLSGIVLAQPTVIGSLFMRGARPDVCTLAAFLAAVWALVTQNGSDTERTQREMELTMPPPEALAEEEPEPISMDDLVARMRAAPGVSTR